MHTRARSLLSSSKSKLSLSISWFRSSFSNDSCWRSVGTLISAGMIASNPKVSENRDSPVVLLGVVLYTQRTPWSSSAYRPFLASSFFFRFWTIVLFVALGISQSGETKINLPTSAEFVKTTWDELEPVIDNGFLRHTEPADYVSSYKAFNVWILNFGIRFCLDPLGEIVSENKQVFALVVRPW